MKLVMAAFILSALALQGCSSARSTIHQGEFIAPAKRLPAAEVQADKPILMIKGKLPDSIKFEVLGEVRVNSQRYSTMDRMYKELAIRARYVGADAVVEVNEKMRTTFIAVVAPTISGVAVRVIDDGGIDLKKLDGQWR